METRSRACMILKNNIKKKGSNVPPHVIQLTQQNILRLLSADARLLRSAAGMLIAAIVAHHSLDIWPGLIEELLRLVREDPNVSTQEVGSLSLAISERHRRSSGGGHKH